MPEKSLAHTKWDCTYHIVFIPKYRRKVLYGDNRQKLLGIIKRLCRDIDVEIVEGAMCPDHIHMSLRIPPRLSVAYVMGYLNNEKLIREEALWIADKLDWEVRQGTMTQDEAAVIINAVEPPLFRVIARWQKNVISDMEAVGRIREIRKAIDVLAR